MLGSDKAVAQGDDNASSTEQQREAVSFRINHYRCDNSLN